MSCPACKHACQCSTLIAYSTQEVVGHSVILNYRTVCANASLASDDDVVDVAALNVTIALPARPTPGKNYRILATQGDVTIVDSRDQLITTVPAGRSLDCTFAASSSRWIPACCGDPDDIASLTALIGPSGVAGLTGALGPAGVAGLVGAIGPAGVAGLVGGIGPQGIQGLIGAIGLSGVAGLAGAIGPAGVTGLVGAIGPQGVAGLVGEQGIQGIAGIVGEQGVAGIAGPAGGISEYGYVYNASLETVAIGDDVDFDANGILTAGITHAPGSSVIAIGPAGDYEVTWSVSGVEPNQFALVLNGEIVQDSLYGSGAGTQESTGRSILRVPAGSTLTLRNNASAAAVTLQPLAGGTQANVNASIRIIKLA